MLELLEIHPGNIEVYQIPVPVSSLSSLRNALNHFRRPMDVLSAAAASIDGLMAAVSSLSQLFSIRYLSDPCLQEISCLRSLISQFYLQQLQLFEDGDPVDFLS